MIPACRRRALETGVLSLFAAIRTEYVSWRSGPVAKVVLYVGAV